MSLTAHGEEPFMGARQQRRKFTPEFKDEAVKLVISPRIDRSLRPLETSAVVTWIEGRYNRRRRHSALGMITPVEFETAARHTASLAA